MAKKEFTYRGLTFEQLRSMTISEFARLVPARERRTLVRGLAPEGKSLLRKLSTRDKVKTHYREMVVVPQIVGKTLLVHNGKEYTNLEITDEMLGHRLGEFVLTRKPIKHASPGVGASKSGGKVSVK